MFYMVGEMGLERLCWMLGIHTAGNDYGFARRLSIQRSFGMPQADSLGLVLEQNLWDTTLF